MSELDQQKQDLSRQIINKIVNDPAFREQLSSDPRGALVSAGFWDAYTQLYADPNAEVSGYMASFSEYCCITVAY